ncbi:MAG: DNA-binding protein [Pseudonocardiales bacterium]|nr:MAG: DNA-binding protein [Pseudonocardiales bacterium]
MSAGDRTGVDAPAAGPPPAGGAREVASLLRSRRERLQPADVGLPGSARRRTPGLRREEVAQLAGISTTYYTFLEQGRDLNPSRSVLDALARALRLGRTEGLHLHELVRGVPAGPTAATRGAVETVPSALVDLVERLDPHPTYVTGRSWDVLAANRAARALWTDWPALPLEQRNVLWWTFMDPAARTVLVEWESEASAQLARFRTAAARHPDDIEFVSLIELLLDGCAEVREWWPRHDVAPLSSGRKLIRHPTLGDLEFQHLVLQLADNPDQKLVTFAAEQQLQARIAQLLNTGS